ncbi:KTSC domain-containing protein [Nocardia sp. NRRL S-836]|uniref:KTSC domain-containing protein n=1 Tax=Nocardia sp. NRRL S-836 TaxID=1519492 RepID=UPI0006AD8530|nr:KTSC domain-containing protein [Nocardia sp. NRRL S-836]
MHHQTVASSNIRSIGYEDASGTLEVLFNNGRRYRYTSVPVEVHRAFLTAQSHGRYFNAHIRDKYPTRKIV